MKRKKYLIAVIFMSVSLGFAALVASCTQKRTGDSNRHEIGGIPTTGKETVSESPKRYNTEDLVVITDIDTDKNTISVRSIEKGKDYVLNYTSGTVITSKNDRQLLMEQMEVGQIAVAGYNAGTQKLIELHESDEAWENTMVVKWNCDYDKKLIYIGSSTYSYDDNIFLNSNGKDIDIREISGIDNLTVRGVGNKAYSVNVDKGHGYVRLTDTVNYVNGIVEIGDRLTAVISKDMVIAAPEGTYKLAATVNGIGGEKEITVYRDQEVVVSLGAFEQPVERYGSVKFYVAPQDAQAVMTIDGNETDYSDLVSLSYGRHTVKLTSNNYETYTKEINISSVYTTINFNMKDTSEEETTGGEKDTTGESGTQNPGSSNNLINVTAPAQVSVYFDGALVGTSPVSFKKVSGEHTLILKKDGYVTKSYTIDVSDSNEDMILSFPDMLKAE